MLIVNYIVSMNDVSACEALKAQTSADSFARLETQTWQGRLIYEEIPPVMSVRAYMGSEFFLIANSPQQNRLVLLPSARVSATELRSLHNQQVEIVAVYVPGTRPSPNETACPLEADGQCMKQGEGYQVLSIVRLHSPVKSQN
jgi:hypothetical protein